MKIFYKKQNFTSHAELVWQREQAQRSELCDPVPTWAGSQIVGRHSVLDTHPAGILPRSAQIFAYDASESHSRDEYAIADQVRNDGKRDRGNSFVKQTETLSPQKDKFPSTSGRGKNFNLSNAKVRNSGEGRKCAAFTLAEVLVTLGIIGTVAALVLPSLITNINDRVNAEKIRSAKYKFTKATDHMKSLGLIGPYSSTDAFVDELQKYFKIAKRCDADHIRACWPTDTVRLEDGKEWDISKTKTGKQLKMNTDDTHDYTSNNVAIITADGTPMILNYNKKCESLDPMKTYGWSTSNGKPESNATAGCVAAVFEINGTSRPNTFRKDVVAFNANGLGSSCAIEIDGKCFGAPFSPTPMTKAECEAAVAEGKLGIKACYWDNDYWAGAVKQCGGTNKMASMEDLGKIASLLYEGNPTVGAKQDVNGLTYNGKASQFGLPEPYFGVWSGEESGTFGTSACDRNFDTTVTYWGDNGRGYSPNLGLCLGD